jgi:hypothetical protein
VRSMLPSETMVAIKKVDVSFRRQVAVTPHCRDPDKGLS